MIWRLKKPLLILRYLVSFSSKTDTGALASISTNTSTHILAVLTWVFDQHSASAIPSNNSKAAFIASLTTEFPTMTNVSINEILNGSPATKRMPDYINWRFNDGGTIIDIKIWFSDAPAHRAQAVQAPRRPRHSRNRRRMRWASDAVRGADAQG